MEAIMLNLSVFSHNHHPSGVNLLAKYIRRGIQVIIDKQPPRIVSSYFQPINYKDAQ